MLKKEITMPVLRKFIQESKCDDVTFTRLCFYYDLMSSTYSNLSYLDSDLSNCDDSDKREELGNKIREARSSLDKYAAIIAIESQS